SIPIGCAHSTCRVMRSYARSRPATRFCPAATCARATNRIAQVNSPVPRIKDLEDLPIRTGSGPTVFVHDIGTVNDSSDILTGYALVNGRRTVYIPVTKRADASTLDVVTRVKREIR